MSEKTKLTCQGITNNGLQCSRKVEEGSKFCWQHHPEKKNNSGRPSDYKPEYTEQVYKLCLLGAIDKDLADFFEVEESTINNWKHDFPEFLESIKKGKRKADANVAERLYKKAMGYQHKEDKIFQYEGQPVIVPTMKKYAPDTTAAIFWLKNRQPKAWREKQEIKHSGELEIEVKLEE